ncbi:MAG: type II toxin-antitoxin system RelE/ParE family toxin [Bacteroidales bacterium]|nr:MAG: type II toxin-antitoxin system RelE/ParE family toxin [Bacteroidales bacterium]
MPYPIRYSTRAYVEYESILEYVSERFGIAKAAEVDMYFENVVDLIAVNPYMFPYSNRKKNLRRCVVSPQTTLYYRFSGECVELVSFRGSKMNPETLGL